MKISIVEETTVIIEKEGKKVMELCILEHGEHAIKQSNRYYTIISEKDFTSILNRAEERGYDLFWYD